MVVGLPYDTVALDTATQLGPVNTNPEKHEVAIVELVHTLDPTPHATQVELTV